MKKNFYETSDFGVCVVLYTLGFKLTSINRSNPNRLVFEFEFEPDLTKAVESYFRGELKLDPRLILLNSRLIKSLIKEKY
jgi:hypothetical protein